MNIAMHLPIGIAPLHRPKNLIDFLSLSHPPRRPHVERSGKQGMIRRKGCGWSTPTPLIISRVYLRPPTYQACRHRINFSVLPELSSDIYWKSLL